MPIFGVTASSNMTTKLSDFYQIATTTVGSGGASEIVFSSIPQDYSHLQIRFTGLTGNDQLLRLNGDTASNYKSHYLYGTGASAIAAVLGTDTYMYFGFSGGATHPYVGVIDILDYQNTNKFKTMRAIAGTDANGSGYAFFTSGLWRSTNAVTSIRLFPSSGSFSQYTSVQLYGVKA